MTLIFDTPEIVISGETPARKPTIAAVPSLGLTPRRTLAPPATSTAPEAITAKSGLGTRFELTYCASISALREVIDSAIQEITAKQETTDQEWSFHRTSTSRILV